MKTNTIELYIHIPFCKSKCRYCDFCSFRAEEETIHAYLGKLKEELIFWGKKLAARDVVTVFIGGGTPSYLRREDIQMICETIFEHFHICEDAEITIEANPGTVDLKKLCTYRENGINRISFGLQSTVKEELEYLGRIHTYEEFLQSFDWARQAGFLNINVDLMSAVPKQTLTSYEENLRKIAKLSPEHISAYSLIIEEGTLFYEIYGENAKEEQDSQCEKCLADDGKQMDTGKNFPKLPDEEAERRMYELTAEKLEAAGYLQYEVSNYAKPGYACRHNMGYWQRVEYLGIGTGAASLIENERYQHISDTDLYIRANGRLDQIEEEKETLDWNAQVEETMFLGLRMKEGVNKQKFRERYHREIQEVYGEVLEKLKEEGLLREEEERICLTKRGNDLSNYVLAQFLL